LTCCPSPSGAHRSTARPSPTFSAGRKLGLKDLLSIIDKPLEVDAPESLVRVLERFVVGARIKRK
jgi:hypothetical protein